MQTFLRRQLHAVRYPKPGTPLHPTRRRCNTHQVRMLVRTYGYNSKGRDTNAFSFNSSAKYRAGGHFKEKQPSMRDQKIMVDDKGSHFQAAFPDIFTDYQNPPLTGDVTVANKAWHNWISNPFDWWRCQLLSSLVRQYRVWSFIWGPPPS